MRRTLVWILVVVVVGVVVYDVSKYALARYNLGNITKTALQLAAVEARGARDDPNSGYQAAQAMAQDEGANVYGYEQTTAVVHVWVEDEVGSTVIIGPVWGLVSGAGVSDPIVVRDEAEQRY